MIDCHTKFQTKYIRTIVDGETNLEKEKSTKFSNNQNCFSYFTLKKINILKEIKILKLDDLYKKYVFAIFYKTLKIYTTEIT